MQPIHTDKELQPKSLIAYFDEIKSPNLQSLKDEEFSKVERFTVLNKYTSMPCEETLIFTPQELRLRSEKVQEFIDSNSESLFRLKLIPKLSSLPKLRVLGKTPLQLLEWFALQAIDEDNYECQFLTYAKENLLSATFIVNENGVFGEVINNYMFHLTAGRFESDKTILFAYDFHKLHLSEESREVQSFLERLLKVIEVPSKEELERLINAQFSHNLLKGYFEAILTGENNLLFTDYNRLLGSMYKDFTMNLKAVSQNTIQGVTASNGKIVGTVRVIDSTMALEAIGKDTIIVTDILSPDLFPSIYNAKGIITNRGGVITHPAITIRELKIPCIVETKNATKLLKDGDKIEMNGDAGTVIKQSFVKTWIKDLLKVKG